MKLITFNTEEVNLPDNRPFVKRVYPKGTSISLSKDSSEMLSYASPEHIEEKIFERIDLHFPDRQYKKRASYFINFDDADAVMPILGGLLDAKTKRLRKQHIKDLETIAQLNDIIKHYRSLWVVRLYEWIIKKSKTLRRT